MLEISVNKPNIGPKWANISVFSLYFSILGLDLVVFKSFWERFKII